MSPGPHRCCRSAPRDFGSVTPRTNYANFEYNALTKTMHIAHIPIRVSPVPGVETEGAWRRRKTLWNQSSRRFAAQPDTANGRRSDSRRRLTAAMVEPCSIGASHRAVPPCTLLSPNRKTPRRPDICATPFGATCEPQRPCPAIWPDGRRASVPCVSCSPANAPCTTVSGGLRRQRGRSAPRRPASG